MKGMGIMIKKEYKKPKIVFEDLAFKSALATCDLVSTTKIENDNYPCYIVEGEEEGGKTWPLGKGEPTYLEGFGIIINGDRNICSSEYYCYHVPQDPILLEEENGSYIGLS